MPEPKKSELQMKLEYGTVTYANEVIAAIAGLAASEVEGVAGMSSGGGIAEMFTRRNVGKGIRLTVLDNAAQVDVTLIAAYGTKMHEMGAALQQKVMGAIENLTGLKVAAVNIRVQGILIDKKEEPIIAEEPKE